MAEDNDAQRRALAIVAHPDDAELCCAGTCAKLTDEGWDVRYIIATSGDKGSHDPRAIPEQVAALREAEQLAAAREIGVRDVIFLRRRDGELIPTMDLRRELTFLLRRYRPHVVFTHDPWRPYQTHPDHRGLGIAVLDAAACARGHLFFPDQLADGLTAWRVPEIDFFATAYPDYLVDITATWERKIRALSCHASQIQSMPGIVERLVVIAEDYGRQIGVRYAEAFHRHRIGIYPDL